MGRSRLRSLIGFVMSRGIGTERSSSAEAGEEASGLSRRVLRLVDTPAHDDPVDQARHRVEVPALYPHTGGVDRLFPDDITEPIDAVGAGGGGYDAVSPAGDGERRQPLGHAPVEELDRSRVAHLGDDVGGTVVVVRRL